MSLIAQGISDLGRVVDDGDDEAALRSAMHLIGLFVKSPLPGIGYNLSNAARNSEDSLDALMKGMGYRQ